MNILFLVCAFHAISSLAGNFIDDPNFDFEGERWSSRGDGGFRSGDRNTRLRRYCQTSKGLCSIPVFRKYREQVRNGFVQDQCLELPPWSSAENYIVYHFRDVPAEQPLYFVVEVGTESEGLFNVEVILVENYRFECGGKLCRDHHLDDWGRGYMAHLRNCREYCESKLPYFAMLSKKNMDLRGKDLWHVVSSEYQGYKKYKDSDLILKISCFTQDISFQINFAQVGTDPKALGGRGARNKNFEKPDEL